MKSHVVCALPLNGLFNFTLLIYYLYKEESLIQVTCSADMPLANA